MITFNELRDTINAIDTELGDSLDVKVERGGRWYSVEAVEIDGDSFSAFLIRIPE